MSFDEFYEKWAKMSIEYEEKRKKLELEKLDRLEKELRLRQYDEKKPDPDINLQELCKLVMKICPDYKVPREFMFMSDRIREELI